MRTRFGLLLLVVLVAAPALAEEARGVAPGAGPRIALEPPTFDFGDALQNKTLVKEFGIRNFGNEDLVVENVSTSCGCTAALLNEKDKVVKPGGSAVLKVTLQTRQSKGAIAKSVMIRSNDPTKSLYELKFQASVVEAK